MSEYSKSGIQVYLLQSADNPVPAYGIKYRVKYPNGATATLTERELNRRLARPRQHRFDITINNMNVRTKELSGSPGIVFTVAKKYLGRPAVAAITRAADIQLLIDHFQDWKETNPDDPAA